MEFDELIKRGEDLLERCGRTASVTNTNFLTPAEQYALESWARRRADCRMILHGGTQGAERRAAFFLPDWLEEDIFAPEDYIRCISLTAGFGAPGHRDYLGAVLGMGIKREWIGDILIDGSKAHIFCLGGVAEHILASLDKVGRYGVRTREVTLSQAPAPKREFAELTFSVQSFRLDAVTAGIFRISRTAAASAIVAGEVSLNYSECLRPDAQVGEGDIISLRGKGKARLASYGGQSRKGRNFVTAEIYK